ncbi:uncharacterized protein LOC62_05G006878 [Vanrija pseudolonga]|uniref:Uncharacterized protein n=1 Tax=Vanrija pseudolonga TaxID=143232 RepID=A0AAF1BJE7_9TREE|nr:hypothetical protein LOC62_05G006878 [Vanrija pseudolonga]
MMMAAHGHGHGPQPPLHYATTGLATPAFASNPLPHDIAHIVHPAPQPPQPQAQPQAQPLAFLEPRVSSILVNPYASASGFPTGPVPPSAAEGEWRRPPPRAIDTRPPPVAGRQRPHSAAAAHSVPPHSAPASTERHSPSLSAAFQRRASAAGTTKRRYAHEGGPGPVTGLRRRSAPHHPYPYAPQAYAFPAHPVVVVPLAHWGYTPSWEHAGVPTAPLSAPPHHVPHEYYRPVSVPPIVRTASGTRLSALPEMSMPPWGDVRPWPPLLVQETPATTPTTTRYWRVESGGVSSQDDESTPTPTPEQPERATTPNSAPPNNPVTAPAPVVDVFGRVVSAPCP